MFNCILEYVSTTFPGTLYTLLGKEVLQKKKWENQAINCYQCLVRLRQINYCFHQKKVFILSPRIRKLNG